MAFITLEDGATQLEAAAFPRTLEVAGSLLCEDALIGSRVQVGRRNGELSVSFDEVFPLAEVAAHSAVCLSLRLDSERLDAAILEAVCALLHRHPGPMPVRLCVADASGDSAVVVSAGVEFSVAPTQALRTALASLAGVVGVALAEQDAG